MASKSVVHKQRTPSPRLTRRVFIGNRSIRDNLAECVKIAIWNAIGDPSHGVEVTIIGNSARLDGKVQTKAQREASAVAARTLPWIASVDNRLKVGPASAIQRRPILLDADQGRLTCA